jgi:hypothetical protein
MKQKELKEFYELKNKCLSVLPKVYNNSGLIFNIRSADTIREINKHLQSVPYDILISNRLIKVDTNESWITKKSVKAILTNMKKQ